MQERHGASPDAWRLWSETLGLTEDLLPVVSNPNAPISPNSKMRTLGKTPSRYNQACMVSGIAEWTSHRATAREIEAWSREPDYGLCVQTRRLRAIDMDVEEGGSILQQWLTSLDPLLMAPFRYRADSSRVLIPFWFEEPLFKHVVPVEGGMIEILGDGQQFVAEGTHPSGERYVWTGYEFPALTPEQFALLLLELGEIATGPIRIAHGRRNKAEHIDVEDDVAAWLIDNWETYDGGPDGQIFIACPFAEEHSTDTGPSSTAYFPAGTGGYSEGNFVCLHAHCTGRGRAEFLNATGFVAGGFDSLPASSENPGRDTPDNRRNAAENYTEHVPAESRKDCRIEGAPTGRAETAVPAATNISEGRSRDIGEDRRSRQIQIAEERWPVMARDSASRIEPTMSNMIAALSTPAMVRQHIAYDRFRDAIVRAERMPGELQWQEFRDTDYARLRVELEARGFKPFGMEMLRLAVLTVAEGAQIDTAVEWLNRIRWDGAPRMSTFCIRGWGWADTPYSRAVGRYVWTALAGRVLEPGCQADMAPILVGAQGRRKTTAIKAMAPGHEFYVEVKLSDKEDNLSRMMRGVLVGELEELRGLNSKAIEEIKAFITRTDEKWIPKFREFATAFPRRLLFFGSTNEPEFLADPTGERRWLPGECGPLDVDWIRANRDQLWAEGATLFNLDGVDWQDAERLATFEHPKFKVSDPWETLIARWLRDGAIDATGETPGSRGLVTIADIAAGALAIHGNVLDRGRSIRIGKAMLALGWQRTRLPPEADGHRPYGYVK